MRVTLLLIRCLTLPAAFLGILGRKKVTITVTVEGPTTETVTTTETEFSLPTSYHEAVLVSGPLHTCFQTVTSPKNWFAIAWKSGAVLDQDRCTLLQRAIVKQIGTEITDWDCFWYYDSRTGKGVTKAVGEFSRKVGKMESAVEEAVRKVWGDQATEQCRTY